MWLTLQLCCNTPGTLQSQPLWSITPSLPPNPWIKLWMEWISWDLSLHLSLINPQIRLQVDLSLTLQGRDITVTLQYWTTTEYLNARHTGTWRRIKNSLPLRLTYRLIESESKIGFPMMSPVREGRPGAPIPRSFWKIEAHQFTGTAAQIIPEQDVFRKKPIVGYTQIRHLPYAKLWRFFWFCIRGWLLKTSAGRELDIFCFLFSFPFLLFLFF